ncbi:hypothetical protein RclHR1_00460031 [Rhizophagus clarus]|uniref:Uncharacterized protein n=1 Tax=Rhizophagus clarus TaxID=94130 RepID=A0A2Z6RN81_9GLOM|nr:hypothetical protein RclHR1_00460031 [Rhizophagus clarus]
MTCTVVLHPALWRVGKKSVWSHVNHAGYHSPCVHNCATPCTVVCGEEERLNSTENERLNDTSEMVHKSQLNFLRRDEAKKSRNDKQEVEDTNKTNETNIKTIIVDEIGDFGSDSSSNARPAMHTTTSGHEPNENIIDQSQDEENPNNNTIAGDSENNLGEATESMAGKVERIALIVDDIDLEELFEEYCNECKNNFDLCHSDIMDLRPISQFTEKLPEAVWENFVTNTYPEYEISGEWEELIQEFFKPKETLEKWLEAWRGLYTIPDKDKSNGSLAIKDAIYNILTPFIKAFKAPYNILKSGDLGENQYNSQFVSPVLDNTLSAILSIDWRILEVPVESSKHRRNSNINPIIDKVLEAKRADGLARLWQSHEEVFIYEQTGPPDFDDFTQVFIHDYKLVRTMRDILNQRIILRLKDGMSDHKDLASFGAFGHRTEVSLFWCMMHQKSYCLQEYGSFKIPTIWQDLPVLAEAITICLKFFVTFHSKLYDFEIPVSIEGFNKSRKFKEDERITNFIIQFR